MSYLRCNFSEEALYALPLKRRGISSARSELPTQDLAVLCEAMADAGEGKVGLAERGALCSLVMRRNVPFGSNLFRFF